MEACITNDNLKKKKETAVIPCDISHEACHDTMVTGDRW